MKKMLLALAAIALFSPLRAQFQNSSLAETLIPGSPANGGHTSSATCYSHGDMYFSDFISDLYVSTWKEGNNPNSFYYKRTMLNDPNTIIDQGIATIPNSTRVYDAVILKNPVTTSPNKYCVAVVYGDASSGASIACYEWTLSGLSLLGSYQFTTSGVSSIRMDAHDLTYYTVVYSNWANNMFSFGGAISLASGYPLIGPVKSIQGNASVNTNGILPDVAMSKISNPPPNMAATALKLYYTYISTDKQECLVSYLSYDALMTVTGPLPLNYEHTVAPMPFSFTSSGGCSAGTPFPRYFYSHGSLIDAPDHSDDSWSVIVEQMEFYPTLSGGGCPWPVNTNKTLQLQVTAAHKINSGPITDVVLNNGGLSGTVDMSQNFSYPFTAALNSSLPTVAFSENGDRINYAWGKTQENPVLGDHDYLGVLLEPSANDAILSPAGEGYRIIDRDPALEPYVRAIAFSGQNDATFNLYTVFTADLSPNSFGNESVYQKHPEWGNIEPIGYKPANTTTINTSNRLNVTAHPNPFNSKLTLQVPQAYQKDMLELSVTDITGRIVLTTQGTIEHINRTLDLWTGDKTVLSNSVYLIRLQSAATREQSTIKVTKQ